MWMCERRCVVSVVLGGYAVVVWCITRLGGGTGGYGLLRNPTGGNFYKRLDRLLNPPSAQRRSMYLFLFVV